MWVMNSGLKITEDSDADGEAWVKSLYQKQKVTQLVKNVHTASWLNLPYVYYLPMPLLLPLQPR